MRSIDLLVALTLAPALAFQRAVAPTLRVPVGASRLSIKSAFSSPKPNKLLIPFTTAYVAAEAESTERDKSNHLFESIGTGIRRDFAMRLPHYASDITDGMSLQCLAATMFLFFACLAPAVGFGGLFATATGGSIGTVEMVSSTAACGVAYALTSAQPLTIIGSTGPVLAFVACLMQLSKALKLPFLPLYAWTGLWTSFILFVSSLTSASNLVKVTESFAIVERMLALSLTPSYLCFGPLS